MDERSYSVTLTYEQWIEVASCLRLARSPMADDIVAAIMAANRARP